MGCCSLTTKLNARQRMLLDRWRKASLEERRIALIAAFPKNKKVANHPERYSSKAAALL